MPQANQFGPLNIPFQPNFVFNSMNASYPSHVHQRFGSGFSFQSLLDAPKLPFDTLTSNTSKGSNKKCKATKKSNISQTSLLNNKWTKNEDIALTKAWLYVSVDSDIGNNQKNLAMWNRILQTWRDNMDVYDEARTTNNLGCRWGNILVAVNKFHALYERLERTPQSGTTPEDMKREAIRMYEDLTNGKPCKYEHCWEILIKNPKWCSKELTKIADSNKQKSVNDSDSPVSFSNQGDAYRNPDTPITEGINSDGVVRQQGRKGTKEKKRRLNDERGVSTLEKQIKVNEEELELKREKEKKEFEVREQTMKKEIELKEKAQKMKEKDQQLKEKDQRLKEKEQKMKVKAQKRQEQDRILNQDVNKLPLALRSTFEIYQAQILKEWENDGLFGQVFTNSDDDK
ncbi:hypothetical protein Dsin_005313 [Dipteronia sinensis]|uniref:No apical meristem-associated C-terminal domain-containing protein n=1 Tax=Dipteronia sinensis TaxID=43782 RepID=A0AAE0AW87_9ROSI|nr:hypothetical protein Dsin_005313 [Dipteronia sinensis]